MPQADLAALAVCMVSALLGSHPSPRAVGSIVFKGAAIGIVVAVAYRLLILPHVQSLSQLMASIAPFLLLGGLARADSRFSGLAFGANQLFLVTSHAALPLEHLGVREVLAGSGALLCGIGLTCLAYALPPSNPQRRTQRLTRKIWKCLDGLCEAATHRHGGRSGLVRHIFNLSRHGHGEQTTPATGSPMAALRLLDSIIRLRRLRANSRVPTTGAFAAAALRYIREAEGNSSAQGERLESLAVSCQEVELAGDVRDAASALRACHWVADIGRVRSSTP